MLRPIWMRSIAAVALAISGASFALPAAAQTIVPKPKKEAEQPPPTGAIRFVADPVTDGAIISISIGFAALLDLVIGTRELKPQVPGDRSDLLPIDRGVIDWQPGDTTWRRVSNVGLGLAGAFAIGDSLYTGATEGAQSGWVDFIMYGESAAITWAVTDLAKLAVRRPRPGAYVQREQLIANPNLCATTDPTPANDPQCYAGTNAALSFFSGHASTTAALSTTATYLAFARSKTPTRGIVTGAGGLVLTSAVAWGRVKGGAHFPTDVIAGAMAGIGIGALVPHLHRETESKPIWIGLGPQTDGWAGLSVGGLF